MKYLFDYETSPNSLDNKIFVIDSECFLIVSADELSGEKHFIRIGNSKKLPKNLISLINTVILPGKLMGNPFNEKLNIGETNKAKYMGTSNDLSAFLKFQKLLKLNIPKENIIKIEYDIPTITDKKLHQKKSEMLGIFTRDGNFKLIDGKKTLFDLFAFSVYSNNSALDIAAENIQHNQSRDSISIFIKNESAFISINNFTVLINGSDLTLKDFMISHFNPESIKYIYNPKKITSSLFEFIKWRSYRQKITIASKINKTINQLGSILNNNVISEKLSVQNFRSSKKFSINSIKKTSSFIIKITTYPNKKIAFINDNSVRKIISHKPDIILINYDAYKDNVLLFKSTKIPIVIINDTSLNISNILPAGTIQIEKNIEYELKFLNLENELEEFCEDFDYIYQNISKGNFKAIREYLNNIRMDSYAIVRLQNLTSLLTYLLNNTVDREIFSQLKKIIQSLSLMNLNAKNSTIETKQYLIIKNDSVYLFYGSKHSKDKILQPKFISQIELRNSILENRIIADNKRLRNFIEGFDFQILTDTVPSKSSKSSKKKSSSTNFLSFTLRQFFPLKQLKIFIGLIILVAIILTTFLVINKNKNDFTFPQILTQLQIDEYNLMPQAYKSEITERHIYLYANELARINGFREINNLRKEGKNPNWILPNAELVLSDGQKIIVKRGDTIWGIAREKLMDIDLQFYKIIHKIEIENPPNKKELLEKAAHLQFSENHKNILKKYL